MRSHYIPIRMPKIEKVGEVEDQKKGEKERKKEKKMTRKQNNQKAHRLLTDYAK